MGFFRMSKRRDKGDVLEQRARLVLKLGKNFVLKLLEGVLTRLNFVDKLALGLFERRLLLLDHDSQALLFETLLLDGEVNDVDLGRDLGRVVRIGHSRGDVHLEFGIVLDLTVADLDLDVISDALDE